MEDSKSNVVTGYVFTLGGDAVSFEAILASFTFEAKLCALDTTGIEAKWLKRLLTEIPLVGKPIPVISLHCDSMTAIAKIKSSKFNQKTRRHI